VVERGSERFAIEIKSARADKPKAIRALEAAATDGGAKQSTLIDQDKGREPLRPYVERCGFDQTLNWLPG
jgi:hypothetical protein